MVTCRRFKFRTGTRSSNRGQCHSAENFLGFDLHHLNPPLGLASAFPGITHGEPDASDALRARIKRQLGWRVRVPEHMETISLDKPR